MVLKDLPMYKTSDKDSLKKKKLIIYFCTTLKFSSHLQLLYNVGYIPCMV